MRGMQESMEERKVAEGLEGGGHSTIIKKGNGEIVSDIGGWGDDNVDGIQNLCDNGNGLTDRLMKEIGEKGLLPPNQTGFRKGKGTIDNIYTLNYLINR